MCNELKIKVYDLFISYLIILEEILASMEVMNLQFTVSSIHWTKSLSDKTLKLWKWLIYLQLILIGLAWDRLSFLRNHFMQE